MAKDDRMHFRLDPAARAKLKKACALTGLDEAGALRACIQAFTDYVDQHGGIFLPLAIVPQSKIPKSFGAAGEQTNAPADGLSTPSTPRCFPDALPGLRARSSRGRREKGKP